MSAPEVLGYGSWGEVQKITRGGKILACKHIRYIDDVPPEVLREIGYLRMLSSNEHIVSLIDAEFCPDGINIYLELMEDGNLNEFLTDYHRTPDNLDLKTISSFSKQILQGLDYIHSEDFVHRDLKPENILLCDNFSRLKICDFGLVQQILGAGEARTPVVYTDWYRPPELQLDAFTEYGKSADLWACGVVLLELVHRTPFFRPPVSDDSTLSPETSRQYIWSKFNYTENNPEMFVQQHHQIPRENLGVQFALGDGRFFFLPIVLQLLLDSKPSLRLPCSEALRILGEGVYPHYPERNKSIPMAGDMPIPILRLLEGLESIPMVGDMPIPILRSLEGLESIRKEGAIPIPIPKPLEGVEPIPIAGDISTPSGISGTEIDSNSVVKIHAHPTQSP